ncbi:MAG: NAD(P)-dependent oxidoreductase [bacterium]|nr:NAD(P)-dependent oxidoreductase [bacterium]
MRIVMTGATSFIGLALTKELIKRGAEVFALVRPSSQGAASLRALAGVKVLEGSLEDIQDLPERLSEPVDAFAHLGWAGSGSSNRTKTELQQSNLLYSKKALLAAKQLGCRRFLFAGSQAEYGRHTELMTEESECRPLTEYGRIKLEVGRLGEKFCRENGMDFVHARIFSVYGRGDHPWTLVESCLRTFTEGGCLDLSECQQFWNFLYIDDAAKALTALLCCDKMLAEYGCCYNVAADQKTTQPLRRFIETMYEISPKRGSFRYGTRSSNAEGPVNLMPDISKISRVTGWVPEHSFEEGVRLELEAAGWNEA